MDMHRTAKEIGLFLTAINLVAVMDSPDVQDKVAAETIRTAECLFSAYSFKRFEYKCSILYRL